jgi:hypothetical protein
MEKIRPLILNVIASSLVILICLIFTNYCFESQKAIAQNSIGRTIPTKWEKVNTSLTELLNSGWQISGHSSSHAAFRVVGDSLFNEKAFTFLLTKNGKYTLCLIENPQPPIADSALCRKLN